MVIKGLGIDEQHFETAMEKYDAWPTTVWDISYSDKNLHILKKLIGDGTRYGWATRPQLAKTCNYYYPSQCGTEGVVRKRESTFNPIICILALNMFGPKKDSGMNVYDPFAGGGARAVVVGKYHLNYYGCEIRQNECEAIIERAKNNEVEQFVTVINTDCRKVPILVNNKCDFLITCPPYYDLEQYDGGENDMSMAPTYHVYCSMINEAIIESRRILKPGAFSAWVVGMHRDKNGELLPIHHDVARLHCKAGFFMKEEIALYWNQYTTGALKRVGYFEKGQKHLIRTHEYCQIFINKKEVTDEKN